MFLSDKLDQSKEFENNLPSIEEDLEDSEITLIIVKENEEFKELFVKYEVTEVPTALILNTNLSVLKKLTNISPADLILETEKFEKVYESNYE